MTVDEVRDTIGLTALHSGSDLNRQRLVPTERQPWRFGNITHDH
jgi:hypothetical protein